MRNHFFWATVVLFAFSCFAQEATPHALFAKADELAHASKGKKDPFLRQLKKTQPLVSSESPDPRPRISTVFSRSLIFQFADLQKGPAFFQKLPGHKIDWASTHVSWPLRC